MALSLTCCIPLSSSCFGLSIALQYRAATSSTAYRQQRVSRLLSQRGQNVRAGDGLETLFHVASLLDKLCLGPFCHGEPLLQGAIRFSCKLHSLSNNKDRLRVC
jgi:hypothetical protein